MMQNLKSKLIAAALALILVFTMAGCGSAEKKDASGNGDGEVAIITAAPKDAQSGAQESGESGTTDAGNGAADTGAQTPELPEGAEGVQPESAPPAPGETAVPDLPEEKTPENGSNAGNNGSAGNNGNAGNNGSTGNNSSAGNNGSSGGSGSSGETENAPEPIIVATGTGWLYAADEETYETIYRLTYPYIDLWGEDVQEYRELESALLKLNEEFSSKAIENEAWLKQAASDMRSVDPENAMELFIEEELFVVRSDSRILSVGSTYSSYGGGAHGMYGTFCYNFDPKTGKRLALSDVVTDLSGMLGKIRETIKKDYPDLSLMNEELVLREEYMKDYIFTVGYDTITFYFDPYVLGSYAEGAQVIEIPFKGNESLIRSEYLDAPEEYGAWFVGGGGRKDLNGDGNPEQFYMEYTMSPEYGSIEKFTLHAGGETYTENDVYAFELNPFLMHVRGKDFLYVEQTVEDDYCFITVYDITGGKIRKVGDTPLSTAGGWFTDSATGKDIGYRIHMTDPGLLLLSARTDVLGTGTVYSYFYVGEDGMPVNYNEGYWIQHYGEEYLTLKQDLTVIAIDPNSKYAKGEEVVLPKGTKLRAYYTDNESYVELCDESENCYWVRGQFVEWPLTVNGIDVDDVFDGVMYAG